MPELSPDQTARIRDTLDEAGDDKAKRARIIAKEAGRLDTTETAIQATGAHVPIQRKRAIEEVRGLVRAQRHDSKIAMEEGLAFLEQKGVPGVDAMAKNLEKRNDALGEGYEALKNASSDQEIFAVIGQFAKAGNIDALDTIAGVYGESRPDLAVHALLQAGKLEQAVALVVAVKRKGFAGQMKGVLAQFDSKK